jgi:5-methylcytosine-specific restriction protein B
MSSTSLDTLYNNFLQEWPISRIETMTLNEYTNLEKTSFCYWLEKITEDLGSIWGGSSYKFGIYRRKNLEKADNRNAYSTDGQYAWVSKYTGANAQEVFETIRKIILDIAKSSKVGDYLSVQNADLGFAYKWKIAFLYSDLKLVNIFKDEAIRKIALKLNYDNPRKAPAYRLYEFLKAQQKADESNWQLGERLWNIYINNSSVTGEDIMYYKYSPGSQASRWNNDLDSESMSINFSKFNTGSLSQYDSIEELADKMNVDPKNSNNCWNLWLFKEANIGDVVIANNGVMQVLGFGIVTGPYEYNESEDEFKHTRNINWIANKLFEYQPNTIEGYPELLRRDTFSTTKVAKEIVEMYLNTYPEYLTSFKGHGLIAQNYRIPTDSNSATLLKVDYPPNQIFYGPPGTGKTYNTRWAAFEIVNGRKAKGYEEANNFFKTELKKDEDKRRIDFITFHQNYSYEDFMVGIRPNINNDAALSFNKYEGVFYKLCKRAKENWLKSSEIQSYTPYFEEVFDVYFKEMLENGSSKEIPMTDPNYKFAVKKKNPTTLIITNSLGVERETMSISTIKALYDGTRSIKGGMNAYYTPLIGELRAKAAEMAYDTQSEKLENFVLIIDEINRANISAVFGELITLIEDDKRLGKTNHIRLQLPNGEFFDIPPNLHIVGTMNTADKSISLIDIALRRRFEFVGYYPLYEEIKNLEYRQLLESINKAIYAKKRSADYLVGHAYFLSTKAIADILTKKVIPLLLEYFGNKTEIVESIFDNSTYKVSFNMTTYQWDIVERKTIDQNDA